MSTDKESNELTEDQLDPVSGGGPGDPIQGVDVSVGKRPPKKPPPTDSGGSGGTTPTWEIGPKY